MVYFQRIKDFFLSKVLLDNLCARLQWNALFVRQQHITYLTKMIFNFTSFPIDAKYANLFMLIFEHQLYVAFQLWLESF